MPPKKKRKAAQLEAVVTPVAVEASGGSDADSSDSNSSLGFSQIN